MRGGCDVDEVHVGNEGRALDWLVGELEESFDASAVEVRSARPRRQE